MKKVIISTIVSMCMIFAFCVPAHASTITEIEKRTYVTNNYDNNVTEPLYGADAVNPQNPVGVAVLVFLGSWLGGEVINGVFKGVVGKTPSDIAANAVKKAKTDAVKKWRKLTNKKGSKVSFKYNKKTGKYTGCSGCGFGGGGGGTWFSATN